MIQKSSAPKVDAHVLALELETYATCESLSGSVAQDYDITISTDGITFSTFNVLGVLKVAEAGQLGLPDANDNLDANGDTTIIDVVLSTNRMATLWLLYDSDDNSNGSGKARSTISRGCCTSWPTSRMQISVSESRAF